jgi:hypothetical protein
MADLPQIRELEARKRLLVATSNLQRQLIAVDCVRLEERAAWVEQGYAVCRAAAPLWKIGAPAALWLLFRKRKSVRSLLGKGLAGLSLGRQLVGAWRAFRRDKPAAG